jgi:hypothetical protein
MPRAKEKVAVPQVPTMSRQAAVGQIREALETLTDEETSICKVAADHGIFCNGFKRYTDNELRRRYGWIVRKRPEMTRDELEEIANNWQLAQQQVHDIEFACDVQTKLHDTCCGWDDFTNEELQDFYKQITGREVRVS